MKNKWLKLCAVVVLLFAFVGISASKVANAETPEVQSVNIADFTKNNVRLFNQVNQLHLHKLAKRHCTVMSWIKENVHQATLYQIRDHLRQQF